MVHRNLNLYTYMNTNIYLEAILLEPDGSLFSVVCEDDISAGAAEAEQGLERHVALVEPSLLRSRLEH